MFLCLRNLLEKHLQKFSFCWQIIDFSTSEMSMFFQLIFWDSSQSFWVVFFFWRKSTLLFCFVFPSAVYTGCNPPSYFSPRFNLRLWIRRYTVNSHSPERSRDDTSTSIQPAAASRLIANRRVQGGAASSWGRPSLVNRHRGLPRLPTQLDSSPHRGKRDDDPVGERKSPETERAASGHSYQTAARRGQQVLCRLWG